LGFGFWLAGCTTPGDTSPKFDPSAYSSFDLAPLERTGGGKVRPEIEAVVIQTLETELTARGWRRVRGAEAGLVVVVRGGVTERVDPRYQGFSTRTGIPVVRGSSMDIDEQNTARLEVFLFDAKTQELLWRGKTTREHVTRKPPPEQVVKALREALRDLPK
jgi:hypothetical protein